MVPKGLLAARGGKGKVGGPRSHRKNGPEKKGMCSRPSLDVGELKGLAVPKRETAARGKGGLGRARGGGRREEGTVGKKGAACWGGV